MPRQYEMWQRGLRHLFSQKLTGRELVKVLDELIAKRDQEA